MIDTAVPVLLFLIAMATALTDPALGTYPLFLLVLTRPVRWLTRHLLGGTGRGAPDLEPTG